MRRSHDQPRPDVHKWNTTKVTANNMFHSLEPVTVISHSSTVQELSYCWDGRAVLHKSNLRCRVPLFNPFFLSCLREYCHKSYVSDN